MATTIPRDSLIVWLRDNAETFERRASDLSAAIAQYEGKKNFGPHDSERLGTLEHEQQYAQLCADRYRSVLALLGEK